MKYYIIAGEASGDLHAGNLIKKLRLIDPEAEIKGFGGDNMIENGALITVHIGQMAFMGVFEVLAHLKTIRKNFKTCRRDILDFKPDVVILVDYAGFNLRMAKFTRENGFRNFFYISPKVWAWKKSRVKKIKATIDHLYLILPFEKEFFAKLNYHNTSYIGNPLSDSIASFKKNQQLSSQEFRDQNQLSDKPIIALLAGSRKQEIVRCLPEMLKSANTFSAYEFVVAGAPSIQAELYNKILKNYPVKIVYNQTYQLLSHAHAAVVTSGTATLETALFRVPQLVVYKFNTLSFIIFRPFIWIKYFSLVNIILAKPAVKEFLQFGLARKIKSELGRILNEPEYYKKIKLDCDELIRIVGDEGSSERAANHMFNLLKQHN